MKAKISPQSRLELRNCIVAVGNHLEYAGRFDRLSGQRTCHFERAKRMKNLINMRCLW